MKANISSNATFRMERDGDVMVLTPLVDLGELKLDEVRDDSEEVRELVEQSDARFLVIDFCEIEYFGSGALSYFLKLWRRVRARDGEMGVCNLSQQQRQVLQVTRFDRLWTVSPSLKEALQAFQVEVS